MYKERSLKTKYILIGLVIWILNSIYFYSMDNYDIASLRILGSFSLFQLVYIILSWHGLTKSYFDAYIVFILACYSFNLGQPILEVFSAVAEARSIITHYHIDLNTYAYATYISTYFIGAFHIGAILAANRVTLIKSHPSNFNTYTLKLKAIFQIAAFFAVISFPGYIFNTIVNMVISATEGYGAVYAEGSGRVKILQLIGDYYAPAMICLYFSSTGLKRYRVLILSIIIITIFFPPLFIGGRSNAVIILAVLAIIYISFHNIKKKQIILLGTGGYIILVIFAAIAGNRGNNNRNLESFLSPDEEKGNPALFTLTEMGGSIQPLIHCLEIIPRYQDYRYGESYLYATTTIIPNVGFWEVHPATKKANLGNWLRDYLNLNYGPGFSIVAEAYYNFGLWGFLMMIILGFTLTKFFSDANKNNFYDRPIKYIMAIVLLWLTIKMVRNSFEFAIRAVVYYYLPMYWLINYRYKKSLKKFFLIQCPA